MKPMKLALAALAAAALGAAAPATAATVVASASSSPFRLDTREGPFESDGTETLTYSTRWHGTADSRVSILQSGRAEPVASGLSGEGDYVWRAPAPGTYTLFHETADPFDGADPESATFTILPPPEPPVVSNVVARQRWPWNGLVDVDYEVGGDTNRLAGLTARITFEERIEGGTGRIWVASNFLAGAEPSAAPGAHRATWDTAADGATDVVAGSVVATVELVRFVPTIPDVIALAQEGTFSLIGSTVGDFSWGQDVDLAYDAAAGCFSVVTTFKPGEFKILFNHEWIIVMGGEIGAVRFNGGNIASEVDGVYKFILDVNTVPFTIRFEDAALP